MKKTDLSGLKSLKHQAKRGEEPQLVFLENVSPEATIKVEISREKGQDEKLFNSLPVGLLLEAQNKIEHLVTGRAIKVFSFMNTVDAANSSMLVIKQAVIDVAHGGEIPLAQNDTVDISLSKLSSVSESFLSINGGLADSPFPYTVKEKTFNADKDEEEITFLDGQFIFFDINSVPSEIELKRGKKKRTLDLEALKYKAIDTYGIIGEDENGKSIYGYSKCIVLDIRNIDSVTLEDESEPRKDIKYYMVDMPY